MKKRQRCSPGCPPRMADGSVAKPTLLNLCLFCWNTGWRIPTSKGPTIEEWIRMHAGKEAP